MPWVSGTPATNPSGGDVLVETPAFTHGRQVRVKVLIWTEVGFDALFEHLRGGTALKSQFIPGQQLQASVDLGQFYVGIGESLRVSTREGADVTGDVQASIFYEP